MKLLAVCSVIVTFCVLPVVDSASVSLSSSQLSLEGNAYIRFDGAREVVWSGLTDGKYIRSLVKEPVIFFLCFVHLFWSLVIVQWSLGFFRFL